MWVSVLDLLQLYEVSAVPEIFIASLFLGVWKERKRESEKEQEKIALESEGGDCSYSDCLCLSCLETCFKKDLFDMLRMEFLETLNIQYDAIKVAEKSAVNLPSIHGGPWENSSEALKPCWNKPALKKGEQSKGLVTSTLANEPENHFSPQGVMPAYKKAKFLRAESSKFEEGIDFDICSQSDVFVLFAIRLFYGNVIRNRIASGRSQVTVPAQINISSAPAGNYISPYISEKNHTFKIVNAVVVSGYSLARLVLPDIRETKWGNERNF